MNLFKIFKLISTEQLRWVEMENRLVAQDRSVIDKNWCHLWIRLTFKFENQMNSTVINDRLHKLMSPWFKWNLKKNIWKEIDDKKLRN